jgi:hypothetical protein
MVCSFLRSGYLCFCFCPLQFATEETKRGPLVVFLKDIEKFIAGGVDTHPMKTKLESVPAGVFIIGSHIQADSRKEKVFCLFLLFTCTEDHLAAFYMIECCSVLFAT